MVDFLCTRSYAVLGEAVIYTPTQHEWLNLFLSSARRYVIKAARGSQVLKAQKSLTPLQHTVNNDACGVTFSAETSRQPQQSD